MKMMLYLKKKFISDGRWLFTLVIICGVIMTAFLFLTKNEVLSIFIPIVLSEIIPRLYSSERIKEKDKSNTGKSDAEVAAEDAIILIMYLTYISTCIAYFVFNFTSKISDANLLLHWILLPLLAFSVSLLLLLKLTDYLSKVIYHRD